ncbi:MAG: hypothetical protein R3B96_15265 [Pirellulaceae bacterium]
MGLESPGVVRRRTTIDVNHDGWLDLYVLDMRNDLCSQQPRSTRFEELTAEYFAESVWGGWAVSRETSTEMVGSSCS